MIWFTSDTHFGHENVLKFTDRPWETIQQMNSVIVANINARVGMAQAEQRIEDLKRENAQLREDLALSRRLEGFHWPWTRDRIKAQHLLPKSTV